MKKLLIHNRKSKRLFLAAVSLMMGLGFIWSGCGESQQAKTSQQCEQSVDEAQKLLRGSRQKLSLNQADLDSLENTLADKQTVSPAQEKLVEKQIAQGTVNRLRGQADASLTESLAQVDQLTSKIQQGDKNALNQAIEQLYQAARKFSDQQNEISDSTIQANKKRLKKAENDLNAAIAQAGTDRNYSAQIAPGLMLASLYLMQARDMRLQLQKQEIAFGTIYLDIDFGALAIALEQNIAAETQIQPSPEIIAQLEKHLAELRNLLSACEEKVAKLSNEKTRLEQQSNENSQKLHEIRQKYLTLLEQAQSLQGDQRYERLQAAYTLWAGDNSSAQPRKSGIYYEQLTELDQSRLSFINSDLALEKDRKSGLDESIAKAAETLLKLQSLTQQAGEAEKNLEKSRQKKAQLIVLLADDLEKIKSADKQYRQLRMDVANSYRQSVEAFTRVMQAAQSAGRDYSKNREFADKLSQTAIREQMELWRQDAGHYEDLATIVLGRISNIPELHDAVLSLIEEYKGLSSQSSKSADELSSQIKTPEEPEEVTAPPAALPQQPKESVEPNTTQPITPAVPQPTEPASGTGEPNAASPSEPNNAYQAEPNTAY